MEMLAKPTHCSLPVPSPIMIFHPHDVYVVNNYIYVRRFFNQAPVMNMYTLYLAYN